MVDVAEFNTINLSMNIRCHDNGKPYIDETCKVWRDGEEIKSPLLVEYRKAFEMLAGVQREVDHTIVALLDELNLSPSGRSAGIARADRLDGGSVEGDDEEEMPPLQVILMTSSCRWLSICRLETACASSKRQEKSL